jgi:hypothetical protein
MNFETGRTQRPVFLPLLGIGAVDFSSFIHSLSKDCRPVCTGDVPDFSTAGAPGFPQPAHKLSSPYPQGPAHHQRSHPQVERKARRAVNGALMASSYTPGFTGPSGRSQQTGRWNPALNGFA